MAGKQQEATEDVAVEPKKKRKKGLLIFIIIILILVLLGGAFTGYAFFTKSFFFAPDDGQEGKVEMIEETMYPLDSFVINLDANGGSRKYLKVSIAIGCSEKKDIKRITEKEVQIKDTIISTLRGQELETLSLVEKEDVVKNEIIKSINALFYPELEINVYFTEYIIQ